MNKYVYDADGKRVRRKVGAQQFWQVYGIDGELIAEYEWNGTTASLQKEYGSGGGASVVAEGATVRWLVTDHLGTPRMIADQTGSLSGMRRHDYLPFGEENFTGATIRTAVNGYQAEGVRQKFTGYERDVETSLDFAQARYYSNLPGRFTSPDDVFAGQDEYDPQTWNLYAYTSNNPVNRIDPDGRRWFYRRNSNGQYDLRWVNPNDDGTYTSPGQGWVELTPDKTLIVYINNGREAFVIGEKSDGSPFETRPIATGKTETNLTTFAAGIVVTAAARVAIATAGVIWRLKNSEEVISVYRSLNAQGEVQYVGQTNNIARRAAEHLREKGIRIDELIGGLSRKEAKAVEQALIEIHGLVKNGGTLLNKINSVAKNNPEYAALVKRGYEILKSIGYKW